MTPALSAKGEAEWRRVKTHLELSEGFCLCFVFSAHPQVVNLFRDRLAAIAKARVTGLRLYEPVDPQDLAEKILPRILSPHRFEKDTRAPVWLDLASQSGPEWAAARTNLLARLNEQREPLRHRLQRPLILVLPLAEKQRIRELVPDLWSIRSFTLEIDGSFAPAPNAEPNSVNPRKDNMPLPLSEADTAAIAEWDRVQKKSKKERGVFLAGGRAFDALYRARRLEESRRVAQDLVTRARAVLAVGETPEALRDLSVSLDNVGKTDRSLGKYEQARAAFTEGFEIGRRLAAAFPDQVDFNSLMRHFEGRLQTLDEMPPSS